MVLQEKHIHKYNTSYRDNENKYLQLFNPFSFLTGNNTKKLDNQHH